MTKQCELCDQPARMYCESDQASLCWECDAKVHGANFLVARHTRSLLCRSCQAPTPWRASGSRLGPTISVCERCLGSGADGGACDAEEGEVGGGGAAVGAGGDRIVTEPEGIGDLSMDDEEDDDDEEDEDEDEDDGDGDDDDGDNQVVPWSMEADAATATPPPAASCSSSEESSSGRTAICQGFLMRTREIASLSSSSYWQDQLGSAFSPSQPGHRLSSSAAAGHSGRMPIESEEETSSFGGPRRPVRDRNMAAPPPSPADRPRPDRLPRGASGTVDVFLPSSSSPPI